jgi:hypothetical protein
MSMLAVVRPDSWNFPLLLHVLGAMILVGATLTGASALGFAHGNDRILRLGYWSLLAVGLPAWVLMFAGAHWIYSKEGLDEGPIESAWIAIGYLVAEAGGLLLVVSLILGGIGVRRLGSGGGSGLLKATMVISVITLAGYVVAVWAMAAKPG